LKKNENLKVWKKYKSQSFEKKIFFFKIWKPFFQIYNLSAVLGKIEDLSIDDLENLDQDSNDAPFRNLAPLEYKGEMKHEFQSFKKSQQKLIHHLFDLTKKDMSRNNYRMTG